MITIVGATGFTGTLIARRLDREPIELCLAGRNQSKLNRLAAQLKGKHKTLVVDVTNSDALRTAIAGSAVVVNCAGPFTLYGRRVVEECISAGIHYLDITGEQQFIHSVIRDFSDAALKNNVTVIPSCAFEYAIADQAAILLEHEVGELESFESNYIIDGMFTSRGTKKSVVCALESPAHQLRHGLIVALNSGEISTVKDADGKTYNRFPFPGGEVYMVPLHAPVKNVSTYLTSSAPSSVLNSLSKAMPTIARNPLLKGVLNALIDISDPTPKKHGDTFFKIVCLARGNKVKGQRGVQVEGRDPYGLTAEIAAAAALRLLAFHDLKRGVVSAAMFSDKYFVSNILVSLAITIRSCDPEELS